DTGLTAPDRRTPGRLHPDEAGAFVDEPGEDADGIGAATNAGDDDVGHIADQLTTLLVGLLPDNAVELTDHPRIRMRSHHRTEAVVRGLDRRHPVAHCL